jgi:hypothetical protein
MNEPMMDKEYEAQVKAESKEAYRRLMALGGNPVVFEARSKLKKGTEDHGKLRKEWLPVERLVETANDMYRRGELDLNKAIAHLASSLTDLAKGKMPKKTKEEEEEEEVEGRGKQEVLTELQTTPDIETTPPPEEE